MIEIEINGQIIQATEGEKLIKVCDRENIAVPRFCYHKHLSIVANCRMCLVDIKGSTKPQPACSTSVFSGMKLSTKNEKVKKSQQAVMEFLLINHPLDCPICDQGGECELQDVAINYGNNNTFFNEGKRVVSDNDIGPLIQTELTRCIHCTRCVRFGDEIAGISEIGMLGRGENMSIAAFLNNSIESELSGNMIDICPVGALTSKPFRFSIRSWEMINFTSIARHDLLGSNLNVQTFENKVYRISARENEDINQSWISDRDRFSYTSLNADNRLLKPKIKIEDSWQEVSWDIALNFAIKGLKNNIINNNKGANLATLVDSTATLEELYLLKKFTNAIGAKDCEYRLNLNSLSSYSYLDSNIKIKEIETVKNIIIIGTNLRFDEPMIAHRIRQAFLTGVTIKAFLTNDSDFNFKIDKQIVQADDFAGIIENLKLDKDSLIVLGSQIHSSKNINNINYMASKSGAKILNITTSGNTIAARKVGFMAKNIYKKNVYILFNLGQSDMVDKLQQDVKNANFVISLNSFTGMEDFANVILPIAGLYETSGTFININNEHQSFSASISAIAEAKSGWKVIKVLADLLNLEGFDFVDSTSIRDSALTIKTSSDQITNKIDTAHNAQVIFHNCYNSDEFTRNSADLQLTEIAKNNLGGYNVE